MKAEKGAYFMREVFLKSLKPFGKQILKDV